MARLRRWVLHPFLFAAFPVITLLTHNLSQVRAAVGLRALVAVLLLAILLLGALSLILRNRYRAAVVTSLFLVLFFSYGHTYATFKQTEIFGVLIGRHRLLAPLWVGMFAGGLWLIFRRMRDLKAATETLNLIALVALAFPLIQFVTFEIRTLTGRNVTPIATDELAELQITPGQVPPDIYYIILDAYSRHDVLARVADHDNEAFLDDLTDMDFYVARCSQSNYAQTELSLASTLNLNYLDALDDGFVSGSADRSPLWGLIKKNSARQALKQLGYTMVAFETGYYWTQLEDADIYYSQSTSTLDALEVVGGVNSFEVMLIDTTASLLLTDAASVLPAALAEAVEYPHQRHRDRVLYDLNKLKGIPLGIQSPKFVFAHIVSPHEPFVFGPEGEFVQVSEPIPDDQYWELYSDQVTYINQRITALVSEIIATSRTPPIIIVQADHGASRISAQDKMAILNAYYLPGDGAEALYSTITPANTFRVLFNEYFNGDFELLEDRSYYSTYDDPYNYRDIPVDTAACGG